MSRKLIGYKVRLKHPDHDGVRGEIVALALDKKGRAGWEIVTDGGERVIVTKLSDFTLMGKKAGVSYGPN